MIRRCTGAHEHRATQRNRLKISRIRSRRIGRLIVPAGYRARCELWAWRLEHVGRPGWMRPRSAPRRWHEAGCLSLREVE